MKKLFLITGALVMLSIVLITAGCVTTVEYPSIDGEFVLINFDNKNLITQGTISMEIDDSEIYGNSGVNDYNAKILYDSSVITIGPISSTKMIGQEPMMTQESEYLSSLALTSGYTQSGQTLTFNDDKGAPILTFVRADTEYLGNWALSTNYNVSLNIAADGFSGKSYVNYYSGTYRYTEDGLKFNSDIISTLMAGTDDLNKAESAYYEALSKVAGSEIYQDNLILKDDSGKTLLTFVDRD